MSKLKVFCVIFFTLSLVGCSFVKNQDKNLNDKIIEKNSKYNMTQSTGGEKEEKDSNEFNLNYDSNLQVYKDNCIGSSPYGAINTDLIEGLANNNHLRKHNTKTYVSSSEKHVVDFDRDNLLNMRDRLDGYFKNNSKNKNLSTGFLCQLNKKNNFLVGGYAYDNKGDLNFNSLDKLEEVLMIMKEGEITLLEGVKVFDNTVTGGMVFPCGVEEKDLNEDYFKWQCILGSKVKGDRMVGVRRKTWEIRYTGDILEIY